MSEEEEYGPSRTELKREQDAIKSLGTQLSKLPLSQYKKLQLDEELNDAVAVARTARKGALQRQLRYLRGMLAARDTQAIRDALEQLQDGSREQVRHLHRLETWRDRLLAGDANTIDEIAAQHAQLDRQHLRQLVRNARRDQEGVKPGETPERAPKSLRTLFGYLRDLE